MGILPLKKRVNRDKCSFTTKQCMFGVFAIDEILRYRGTRFPGSRTLCHPGEGWGIFLVVFVKSAKNVCCTKEAVDLRNPSHIYPNIQVILSSKSLFVSILCQKAFTTFFLAWVWPPSPHPPPLFLIRQPPIFFILIFNLISFFDNTTLLIHPI